MMIMLVMVVVVMLVVLRVLVVLFGVGLSVGFDVVVEVVGLKVVVVLVWRVVVELCEFV